MLELMFDSGKKKNVKDHNGDSLESRIRQQLAFQSKVAKTRLQEFFLYFTLERKIHQWNRLQRRQRHFVHEIIRYLVQVKERRSSERTELYLKLQWKTLPALKIVVFFAPMTELLNQKLPVDSK